VLFSFYDGELFRIAINYDRHETEGLTADDFIAAISATYGTAERPIAPAGAVQGDTAMRKKSSHAGRIRSTASTCSVPRTAQALS
jgi:hypothetical protein